MQISLSRPSDKDRPVRAAWGRGKVAWGGVGLSRVEYHGTDAQANLTSGRRPSGVGGYEQICLPKPGNGKKIRKKTEKK